MKTVRISDERGDYVESSLESFVEENSVDESLCDMVQGLRKGEFIYIGGGAAPRLKIEIMED